MPAWAQPTGALPYQPTADRPELTPSFREDPMPMNAPAMSASPLPRPSELPADAQPQARLPLPHQPKLAEIDPTLYEYWREHINQGFQRNNRMFDTILDAFMRPYNTTIWMYRILFGLGIAAFLVAAGLGAWLREPMFSLIFGGLSIVSFLTYFIGRPLQSLEENLKFITWLGIIYNTYWTRSRLQHGRRIDPRRSRRRHARRHQRDRAPAGQAPRFQWESAGVEVGIGE
ncbi:MAG: hypothetical protein R2856_09915 [Caldilineaceae bacterium]